MRLIIASILISLFSLSATLGQETRILRELASQHIKVSASSAFETFAAANLLDDKSFKQGRLIKNSQGRDMWLSGISEQLTRANEQTPEGKGWIQFEFDRTYAIEQLGIWNYNQNDHTRRGLRDVYVHYSKDGQYWQLLRNGKKDRFRFPESGAAFEQEMDLSIALKGLQLKGIIFTIAADSGNYYHAGNRDAMLKEANLRSQNINYYGLGKVRFYTRKQVKTKELAQLNGIKFIASQGYLKTKDGPSREFKIVFDQALYTGATLSLKYGDQTQTLIIPKSEMGLFSFRSTLLPGYMEQNQTAELSLTSAQGMIKQQLNIPAARKWELHFIPHSHQDIGYTHRQNEVLQRQWDNLEEALDLIDATAQYPTAAQFKWNTEATWYLQAYLRRYKGTHRVERLKQAIRQGKIAVDASLGSMLSGISKQEELMHYFDDAQQLEKELGMEFKTVLFSDVPGASWGMTSAFAQNNIRYFSSAPNYTPNYPAGGSRLAHFHRIWGDKPFYWKSASGQDSVLYWATGTGYSLFHSWIFDRLSVCGLDPIWEVLENLDAREYAYPITYMRYTIHGDNGPPDRDMADVIKKWNETYAYPRFSISTMENVFQELEDRYGKVLPSYAGDMSPVWEDGAASSARELALNRSTAEKLNQIEIQWSTVSPEDFPTASLNEAWKYVNLFSEHTWGAANSFYDKNSTFTKDQWEEKKGYALTADSISKTLENELLSKLSSKNSDVLTVWNHNSWNRTDLVSFQSKRDLKGYVMQQNNGTTTPLQKQNNGDWFFLAKDIPGLSSKSYRLVKSKTAYPNTLAQEDSLFKSDEVGFSLDKNGVITGLSFNRDNYDYAGPDGLNKFYHTNKGLQNLNSELSDVKISVQENGPVMAVVSIQSNAPGCHKLTKELHVIKGIDRLDIKNIIDKTETDVFENIRFSFDFNISNPEVNLDQAWGSIFPERQQLRGVNKNFYSVQNQIAVMNSDKAVTLTTTDAPFVEIGNMTGEGWRTPDRGRTDWQLSASLGTGRVYSWVMNNSWTTNYKASQPGITAFRYSISPTHTDNLATPKRKGIEAVQKMTVVPMADTKEITAPFEIIETNKVAVSTMKVLGDNLFVRIVNQDDATVHYKIDWKDLKNYYKYNCDNKGQVVGEIKTQDLWLKPYAIQNILITSTKI